MSAHKFEYEQMQKRIVSMLRHFSELHTHIFTEINFSLLQFPASTTLITPKNLKRTHSWNGLRCLRHWFGRFVHSSAQAAAAERHTFPGGHK